MIDFLLECDEVKLNLNEEMMLNIQRKYDNFF